MKKVIDIFAKAELPAVLCVASDGGTDAAEVTFTKHTDATTEGKSVVILSNVDGLKSPITGEAVGTVGEVASADNRITMETAKVLASMVCVASCAGCSHDMYVTPDVAAELDTHTIHCASCGEEVEAVYTDDLLSTAGEDDADDDSDDVTDALDEDVDETDDAEEGDDADSTSDDADDSSDEDTGDSSEDDSDDTLSDDDTSTDETEEDETEENTDGDSSDETDETDTEEDDDAGAADESSTTVEQPTRVLPAIVVASVEGQRVRLASLTDTARLEAFVGDTHIGSLFKDECSEGVKAQFGKLDVVTSAFASTFWKNQPEIASGKVESLKEFGFKPANVTVAVDKVVAQQIDAATQEAETKSAEAIQQAEDAVVASFQVAAAGINKGMLSGTGITNLYTEVAKLLTMYGVQSAEEAAGRFVEKFSASYLSGIVTAAAELRTHEPKYVEGLAKAYETAAYKKVDATTGDADLTLTTSSLVPHKPAKPATKEAPVVDTSAAEKQERAHIRNAFARFRG
ncbi:Nop14-like family protein [Rhizobium phage RHEph12]|nr:Nop14-like family protein [Rhizobium phage RHEph12]